MAKKSPANSKATKQSTAVAEAKSEEPVKATPALKAATKPADDQGDNGIGVADIKKAVSFANSVGGLEKAVSLLQILKVAKDVQ